ncbi:MAG: hypothetical protein JRC90_12165 [Deltaproteobacteria bacterium]|nr:hypothetical protein [Deltaproteobacteria bacterium]
MKYMSDKELEEDIRKDYEDFRVKDEAGRTQDILIWTREAQHKDTLRQVRELLDGIENPYPNLTVSVPHGMVIPNDSHAIFHEAIQTIKALLGE